MEFHACSIAMFDCLRVINGTMNATMNGTMNRDTEWDNCDDFGVIDV